MDRVYLLEDDESICELIKCALELSGIELQYSVTIGEFFERFSKNVPDVALIDIMLGDGSGIDVLKRLKQTYPEVCCIMVSALSQESDKVKCLNLGADDYITKPFGILELSARVKVALRRIKRSGSIVCGDLTLNEDDMSVMRLDEKLDLNNKEYQLLKYFIRNEGKALSREQLLNAVWDLQDGQTRTVDIHIARLRKLGVTNIETVFGVGYKLVASDKK